jgi:hypothetical protein
MLFCKKFKVKLLLKGVEDLAFFLNTDLDPGSQANGDQDPNPSQTLSSQKVGFDMKNILYVSTGTGNNNMS